MSATILEPEVERLPPSTETPIGDTCYLCTGSHHTECEICEQPICKEHTVMYEGWCHVERTLCPKCEALKQRVQASFVEELKGVV